MHEERYEALRDLQEHLWTLRTGRRTWNQRYDQCVKLKAIAARRRDARGLGTPEQRAQTRKELAELAAMRRRHLDPLPRRLEVAAHNAAIPVGDPNIYGRRWTQWQADTAAQRWAALAATATAEQIGQMQESVHAKASDLRQAAYEQKVYEQRRAS